MRMNHKLVRVTRLRGFRAHKRIGYTVHLPLGGTCKFRDRRLNLLLAFLFGPRRKLLVITYRFTPFGRVVVS